MSKKQKYQKSRMILLLLSAIFLTGVAVLGSWTLHLNARINQGLKQKELTPINEFFALGSQIFVKQRISPKSLEEDVLQYKLYKSNKNNLLPGEFRQFTSNECINKYGELFPEAPTSCMEIYFNNSPLITVEKHFLLAWNEQQEIMQIENIKNREKELVIEFPPLLFAQYYGDEPILKRRLDLGGFPAICLNAVLAIEDPNFLKHKGFSIKSIARAIVKNIQAGRKAQGGSTITQQLVKNYFLTHKKSYIRKIKELIMAVLLEIKSSKDDILEAYLNEIYMAQNGVFQVRGFGAASEYYFGKPVEDANPAECAMLAAILNSPGRYNPYTNPENASGRRELVLKKLKEEQIIDQQEFNNWNAFPLPSGKIVQRLDPAPYFLEAVKAQLEELNISDKQSIKVVTTLNLKAQKAAKKQVQEGLNSLESWFKHLKDKKESGKHLEAALVSVDPLNGYVSALIGGRSFKTSPYNRILKAKRQVGSIMKPFVYLTALESYNPERGGTYTPTTKLIDEKFSYSYDNQSWSPSNYDKKYRGEVPLFYALKESLNAATAKLAIDIGLENIVDLAYRLGVKSELKALPSLSLGAYELHPYEVLQAYSTLSRLGERTELSFISQVFDINYHKLYEHKISKEQVVAKDAAAALVGILKQTIDTGTGTVARKLGFDYPAAGKTGTTSNYHDAWFAGFTPFHVAVVWVGYDDNTSHGLTGATGAAPIWAKYMKEIAMQYPPSDFNWPDSVTKVSLAPNKQKELGVPDPETDLNTIDLIFRAGNEP